MPSEVCRDGFQRVPEKETLQTLGKLRHGVSGDIGILLRGYKIIKGFL